MKKQFGTLVTPVLFLLVQEDFDGVLVKLKLVQRKDDAIKSLVEIVEQGGHEEYVVKNNLYRQKDGEVLIVVPKLVQEGIIRQTHEKGHFSADKTKKIIQGDYWFPKINSKVETQYIVRNCIHCVLAKRKQNKKEEYLHSIKKNNTAQRSPCQSCQRSSKRY
ncbi:hypothetical protein HZH68_002590 [Vespula germanica]|uniref:Integrase zinc-binding domain-containing protein n=1 Tax=Vespula germanica TaxID=30212 RepID=A0A834U102_VESGE|nr:hypothetical protein HZH68_002590 [Vespula germanica]